MVQKVVMTREGLSELKKELDELLNTKRPDGVARLSLARGQGDLSENSEYAAAKQDLSFIDGRIAELEKVISEAQIVASHSKSKVDVGCKVTLHVNGKKDTYHIVGEWEADPIQKKISNSSPLGKALLGRKVGEKVEVEAPAGKIAYKIMSIE
ncbi:transcription elongation factor GreA [Candidatus Gottesmanbacteria bacterium]|nr:transcription elongation factor GreA [Candidatus Gottesmanbacteria bacterium]